MVEGPIFGETKPTVYDISIFRTNKKHPPQYYLVTLNHGPPLINWNSNVTHPAPTTSECIIIIIHGMPVLIELWMNENWVSYHGWKSLWLGGYLIFPNTSRFWLFKFYLFFERPPGVGGLVNLCGYNNNALVFNNYTISLSPRVFESPRKPNIELTSRIPCPSLQVSLEPDTLKQLWP
jgi:hypothetical protein